MEFAVKGSLSSICCEEGEKKAAKSSCMNSIEVHMLLQMSLDTKGLNGVVIPRRLLTVMDGRGHPTPVFW